MADTAISDGSELILGGGIRFGREPKPSSRECEVLSLLARGATDKEIAQLLELSPATVQTHVRNAKAKLGARTRAQAVALALRSGLIRQHEPARE